MSVVADVVQGMVTTLQSIAGLQGKTFHILTEEELFDRAKAVPFPAVGVVYEGMRSLGEPGKPTHKTGLSAKLNLAVVVFYQTKAPVGQVAADALKPQALDLLDTIRNTIRVTPGPGTRTWEFLVEAPAVERNGVVVYIQRWTIPVMLSQGLP